MDRIVNRGSMPRRTWVHRGMNHEVRVRLVPTPRMAHRAHRALAPLGQARESGETVWRAVFGLVVRMFDDAVKSRVFFHKSQVFGRDLIRSSCGELEGHLPPIALA
jgi:hypothetical protein